MITIIIAATMIIIITTMITIRNDYEFDNDDKNYIIRNTEIV